MKHLLAAALLAAIPFAASAQETPSVEGTTLYFIGLSDGDTVASPLTVQFGMSGMGVAPGSHTLQLVLGDHGHVPHLPPVVSEVITVTVQ